jgi:undecaprenyl-diphosphatase
MLEFLINIDTAVFYFFNKTIANPIFDKVFPFITNLDSWLILYIFFIVWMLWKGGTAGRICFVTLIIGIILSDQISSSFIKELIGRPRPCHILSDINLLVPCGPGKSLPSSHAVNMFASAVILSHYYKQHRWIFFTIAGLVAFSRVYIGVHYPFDVISGAVIGACIGFAIIKPIDFIIKALIEGFIKLKGIIIQLFRK